MRLIQPHPWADISRAPLFVARFPARAAEHDVAAFMRFQEDLVMNLGSKYAWLLDMSHIVFTTPRIRQMVAESDKRLARVDKEFDVGSAFVVQNAVVRGMVTAVFWLNPPVYPYKIFPTMEEGNVWAVERLKAAGIEVPPTLPPVATA